MLRLGALKRVLSPLVSRRFATSSSTVKITFVNMEGNRLVIDCEQGDTLLQVARKHDLPIDGACEGGGAPVEEYGEGPQCPFCHVYISNEHLERLPEMSWRENDVLDDAIDRRRNSRLGCQIRVTPELEGMTVAIPEYPDSKIP